MSKPLWWKNAVKIIKKFTTDDSYMTFETGTHFETGAGIVYFIYHVEVEGMNVMLEEMVSFDALEAVNLQDQLAEELHESFRGMLLDYINDLDYEAIVGM
ncbi:MAG: hypothetical protein EB127_18140 [Alphaproteobacteria bacterium]|nr:hypothetical protein [Alphaproteobacteria bacterium]